MSLLTDTASLIDEIRAIPDRLDDAKARKRENWPVKANRASELGHPCVRYLTYLRVAWQERALPSIGLQYLFDERKRQEDHAIEDLKEAGYTFIQQQRPFSWPQFDITGTIDGMIVLPRGATTGTFVPGEIKNINPWDWGKIEHQPDARDNLKQFLHSDRVWLRKIPSQITLYLLMNNAELGALILRNASDGQMKVLPILLDLDLGEQVLRKAETVNAHVATETLPDRAPYDEDMCGRCPFHHICLPDQAAREGAQMLDQPELEEALERRAELEPIRKEYESLDKRIKDIAKVALGKEQPREVGEGIVGTNWLLRVKTLERAGYVVEPTVYQRVEIHRLGAPKVDADA